MQCASADDELNIHTMHSDIAACMHGNGCPPSMQYVSKPGVPELLSGLGFHLKVCSHACSR